MRFGSNMPCAYAAENECQVVVSVGGVADRLSASSGGTSKLPALPNRCELD